MWELKHLLPILWEEAAVDITRLINYGSLKQAESQKPKLSGETWQEDSVGRVAHGTSDSQSCSDHHAHQATFRAFDSPHRLTVREGVLIGQVNRSNLPDSYTFHCK